MRIHYLSLSFLVLLVSISISPISSAGIPNNALKVREFNLSTKDLDLSDPSLVINKMIVKEIDANEIKDTKPSTDSLSETRIPYANKTNNYSAYNVIEILDKIIAIGEKIIPLIEKGRAVYNSKNMEAISVIPNLNNSESSLSQLTNWSYPVSKHYKVSFENLYGIEVVSFVYSVSFQYNGSYAGKGKYLTGVRIATRDVKVLWGFDVDAHSELIQISNVGTATNVVAGATIEITYTIGNILNVSSTSESFHVTGDGRIFKLD